MQKFDVNKLRVASPCSVGWETMTGDERVRHCHACQRNIYNTAEMTTTEVQNLIENREGRLCIRMYRRADWTVLTKDCPVGLRAVRKRVGLFAGTAMSAVLGLFSVSFAQKMPFPKNRLNKAVIERTKGENHQSKIQGSIRDPQGVEIPLAKLKLFRKGEKTPVEIVASEDGGFVFDGLTDGIYRFEAMASGFKTYIRKSIRVKQAEKVIITVYLDFAPGVTFVGLLHVDDQH